MSNNFEEEALQGSLLDLFALSQESLDDAKRKNASESSVKTQYFQMTNDGTYAVRIVPLAPVIGADGKPLPSGRKGYEYPQKDIFLKIQGVDKNGKQTFRHVPVCHSKLVYPNLQNDLIDLYVQLACEVNASDKEFCDKISGTSFNGGLKYNSKRCMYVLDMAERGKGLQILQLSFSQYRDLEAAKLRLWGKLSQKNPKTLCPISSPLSAFPVEISRTTEKKKTSYSINIDTISGTDELTQEEMQAVFDAPRLPDVLYVYRRFHLEATIEYLKQLDEQYGLDIMSMNEIKDCIDQIKMCLPADDQSHFTINTDDSDSSKGGKMTLNKLWEMFEDLEDQKLGDRTEEGQNLRTLIREFIEDNDLDIRVDRKKTNEMVLEEIQSLMETGEISDPGETLDSDDDEDIVVEDAYEEVVEDDEPEIPVSRQRNDDTNEPAARAPRTHRSPRRR